jgi:hypothetical protein
MAGDGQPVDLDQRPDLGRVQLRLAAGPEQVEHPIAASAVQQVRDPAGEHLAAGQRLGRPEALAQVVGRRSETSESRTWGRTRASRKATRHTGAAHRKTDVSDSA